jgi:hypothetical protein
VRSYLARGNQLCVQVGRLRGGRLWRVFAGGRSRALRLGELSSCATTHVGNVPTGGPLVIERLVDDPRRAHPRIVRTVVAGAGGAAMGRVTVRAHGVRARSFRLTGRGTFLAVLPGRVHSSDVVLTYHRRSAFGQILIVDNRGRPGPDGALPGSARVERTHADPAGGRPYGLLVWRSRSGGTCSVVDRLVAGEVGNYDAALGTFDEYPVAANASGCPPLSFAGGPLVVVADVGETGVVVNGFARGDVVRVTVADERGDPHELGLSARSHAFLDVRRTPGGPLRVTATLRDGTTVTQDVAVGVPGQGSLRVRADQR